MSPSDYKRNRLNRNEARKLISRLIQDELFVFHSHAFERMEERQVSTQDVLNVLESPDSQILGEGEFEKGSWRYRLCTNRLMVVVSFNPSGTRMIVITVIRRSQ